MVAKPPRLPRRALHGVLLLDKPLGWTSNDALVKVRGMLRAAKAGHTGTLDPLATGLLPLCFGAATKFSHAALDADKTYRATLALGATTTTGDLEGEVVRTRPVAFDEPALRAACAALTGSIDQTPPMHSALKHEGKALYEYARAGVTVERPSRRVHIHRLDILGWHDGLLEIETTVSKGTYIRTLAEDLGELLGCGAHLRALRRTASGPLHLDAAVTMETLQSLDDGERLRHLLPPESLLADWPALRLDASDAGRFLSGLRRRTHHADAPQLRVHGPEAASFLGTGHVVAGELIPSRLLSPLEVRSLVEGPVGPEPTSNAPSPASLSAFQSVSTP